MGTGRDVSVIVDVEAFLYRVIMMLVVNHMSLYSLPCSVAADLTDLRTTHEPRRLGSDYPAFVDAVGLGGLRVHISHLTAAAKLELLWHLTNMPNHGE